MRTHIPGARPCLVAMLVAGAACQARAPADLRGGATSQADLVADTAQARLWRAAGARSPDQPAAVAPAEAAVSVRQRAQVPDRQPQGQEKTLPPDVRGGMLVGATPALPGGTYSGTARVAQVTGERIVLQLGQQQLALTARARGGALRIAEGEDVQLELRVRDEPANRQRIVAVRTRGNDGIVSILDTGPKPVSVTVRLFGLTARQVGAAEGGTMSVEVQMGNERRTLTQGQIVDFADAGYTVGLRSSLALTGADQYRAEGNPYAIDLIAWRR